MKPSHRMLTGEIFGALVALSFAWSGMGGWPLEPSYLHRSLARQGDTWLWSLVIGVPALVLFVVSMREYWAVTYLAKDPDRRWSMADVERSSRIRGRMCIVMSVSWLYMLYTMLKLSALGDTSNGVFEGLRANAIMPIALFGFLCMWWSWWENRRVQRDVRKQTGLFPAYPGR